MNDSPRLPHFRRPIKDAETGQTIAWGKPEPGVIARQETLFGSPDPVVQLERDRAVFPLHELRRVPVALSLFD